MMNAELVSFVRPASFEGEQYRMLRHVVEDWHRDARVPVLGVTSPVGGDGKTTTAINLCGALAQSPEARVLIVDLDLRRPTVARKLGLGAPTRSLEDGLREPDTPLVDLVQYLTPYNLSVLPARGGIGAPYEALESPRLEALLKEATARYDFVVLDTPPFMAVPDCRLIGKHVGAFLVVVAAHRTPRRALGETLSLLEPTQVLGLVFNQADVGRSTYSYYDGYAVARRPSRWQRVARKAPPRASASAVGHRP